MTLVHIDLAKPALGQGNTRLQPSRGAVTWRPSARFDVDDTVVLPEARFVRLVDGKALVDVEPSTASWCWLVDENVHGGESFAVAVPDVPDVQYADLQRVDPDTFEPTAEPTAAWTATVEALGARVSTVEAATGVVPGANGTTYTQATPAATWTMTVPAGLGRRPAITLYDLAGDLVEGGEVHATTSTVTITFAYPFAGFAVLS